MPFLRTSLRGAEFFYVYDGDGNIVRSIDILANREYNYEYEEGKIVRATESKIELNSNEIVISKTLLNSVRYYYNDEGQMTKKVITFANNSTHTVYFENKDDNNVVRFEVPDLVNENKKRIITSHSKNDSFGRKIFDELQLGTGFVSREFSYCTGAVTQEHIDAEKCKSSPTTQLVSRIVLTGGRTLDYEYDAEERITKVTDSVNGITEYTYDALGQLETETKDGVTTKFEYDNYGNITAKGIVDENGEIAPTTKIIYAYGNDAWKDLLTSYNGQSITYDAQGNPTSYLGHTLTWEKGRQLKSFDNNTYTYNANGIRTSKTVNGVLHNYTLDGTKILRETWNGNTLIPLYDNEDSVCGIIYNDVPYYFIKNLQGDVIAIVDKDAQTVAKYSYDAWGKIISITDKDDDDISYIDSHIANINPFRYRSYYYDEEIELYYLQSRYYDASVGRFINVDDTQTILCDGLGCIGYNIFTYCQNTPTNGSDVTGKIFIQVFAKIILGIILGVCCQLVFDVIEHLIKLISNPNAKLTVSAWEYILSIASCTLAFFNINNRLVRILVGGIQIVLSYIKYTFKTIPWTNLITDLMFLFVSEIIGGVLDRNKTKKIEKATKTINKNKKKLSKILRTSKLKNRKILIEQNFYALGVGITFSFNISNKIINTIANIFVS